MMWPSVEHLIRRSVSQCRHCRPSPPCCCGYYDDDDDDDGAVNDATRTSDWDAEFVSVTLTESSCLLVGYSHCLCLSVCLSVYLGHSIVTILQVTTAIVAIS